MNRVPAEGEDYEAGEALGDAVRRLLPPGAGFVLLVGITEENSTTTLVGCISNFADQSALYHFVRLWVAGQPPPSG